MRPRNLVMSLIIFALSCVPMQVSPNALTEAAALCSGRVGTWSDCKSRCLPKEQLYAQCSTKLGVIFSTRAGLDEEQQYGWTQEPAGACGGVVAARIWKLKRVNVSKATTGYLSIPETTTPDCSKAFVREAELAADRIYYVSTDVTETQAAYLDSMSTPITPASPTQIVQTFNAPADGDIANAASVNTGFQALENSVEALRYLTYGGGFFPRVKATSNTVMVVQPLGAVVVKQLGVWTAVPHSVATTIDPLALAGGAFAANTRYYVYVNLVAGVITWSVSTTAPDVGWRYKTGDEQYQFITTFYTDSTPNLLTYAQSGKEYKYTTLTATGGGVRGNIVLDLGSALVATAFTTVGGSVPTGASHYITYGQAATAAAAGTAVLGVALPSINSRYFHPPGGAAAPYTQDTGWSASTTSLEYFVDAGTTALNVWIVSFTL